MSSALSPRLTPISSPRPELATRVDIQEDVPFTELYARVARTRAQHGDVLDRFHQIWYEAGHTWGTCNFLGVPMMKCPMDLWAYHDLLVHQRPMTVLETGTFAGGSALWFAVLMDMLGIDGGRVLTVDLDDYRGCDHPRITFYGGDSTNPNLARTLASEIVHPLLVSLDADHSTAHVRKELDLYAPHVQIGEYLIVEDTNISWGDERGAHGAVADYLTAHPGEFRQDLWPERFLVTMHPGGWLQRVAEAGQ